MKVLGFDPSLTNFGWALYDSDEPVGSPTRCLERGRFQTSSKTLFVDRYIDLRQRIRDLVQRLEVRRLGLEYPVFGNLYSEGMYGLYLYTCEALKAERCDVVFFSPGQAKAHAREVLGRPKGWKMMKPDMVEAAKLDTGSSKAWNHNEADAYWIARTAARFWLYLDGVVTKAELTPLEQKQFSEVHTFTKGKNAGRTVQRGILYREDERFFRWSLQESVDGEESTEASEG